MTVSKRIQGKADAARATMGGLRSLYPGSTLAALIDACIAASSHSEIAFPKGGEKRRFGNERADTDAASGLIRAV